MTKERTTVIPRTLMILLLLSFSASIAAQKVKKDPTKDGTTGLAGVVWRDPGDIASLNLLYGAGGKEHAPDPNGEFIFVKEDKTGTSPKFEIKDAQGAKWNVKMGHEPQAETAATRLLWAAGYFVDEDYYLSEFKVTGLPKLNRGGSFVSADGTVRRARLERHLEDVKYIGSWDWLDNPFLNQREMNGLRIMMSLVNNWDLKTMNNSILEVNGECRYLIGDAGATFGNTGGAMTRSKSDLKGYTNSTFIGKTTPDYVDFVQNGKMQEVTKHIPRADARWLGQRLSQLSTEQIRDCFRAAGYTPEEVEGYAKAVQKRIAELNAL
jgi:hypothetical protein